MKKLAVLIKAAGELFAMNFSRKYRFALIIAHSVMPEQARSRLSLCSIIWATRPELAENTV